MIDILLAVFVVAGMVAGLAIISRPTKPAPLPPRTRRRIETELDRHHREETHP